MRSSLFIIAGGTNVFVEFNIIRNLDLCPGRHFAVAASCLPESRIKKEDAREPESSGIIMKKF